MARSKNIAKEDSHSQPREPTVSKLDIQQGYSLSVELRIVVVSSLETL